MSFIMLYLKLNSFPIFLEENPVRLLSLFWGPGSCWTCNVNSHVVPDPGAAQGLGVTRAPLCAASTETSAVHQDEIIKLHKHKGPKRRGFNYSFPPLPILPFPPETINMRKNTTYPAQRGSNRRLVAAKQGNGAAVCTWVGVPCLWQSLQNWEHSTLTITTSSAAKTYFPSISDRGFCEEKRRGEGRGGDLFSEWL